MPFFICLKPFHKTSTSLPLNQSNNIPIKFSGQTSALNHFAEPL